MLPVECVARGYLTGSGLIDYEKTGKLCGIALPPGLVEASKFVEPLFTPATKAELGQHDENISFNDVIELVGAVRAEPAARTHTADLHPGRRPCADATESSSRTPSSSSASTSTATCDWPTRCSPPTRQRYWRADDYQEGVVQHSFDKQFVRNWLTGPESGWDRNGDKPPPPLPPDIVDATRARYIEAYERISGLQFQRLDRSA